MLGNLLFASLDRIRTACEEGRPLPLPRDKKVWEGIEVGEHPYPPHTPLPLHLSPKLSLQHTP